MFARVTTLAAALALALLLSAPSASGKEAELRLLLPSPALLGTWTTTGDSIVKVVIRRSKPGWVTLVVYGRCQPTFCNWGTVRARLFADGAFARVGTGLTANYDLDFALTTVTAHLAGGTPPTLRVESYRRFVDGSGRSDYWRSEDMRRR